MGFEEDLTNEEKNFEDKENNKKSMDDLFITEKNKELIDKIGEEIGSSLQADSPKVKENIVEYAKNEVIQGLPTKEQMEEYIASEVKNFEKNLRQRLANEQTRQLENSLKLLKIINKAGKSITQQGLPIVQKEGENGITYKELVELENTSSLKNILRKGRTIIFGEKRIDSKRYIELVKKYKEYNDYVIKFPNLKDFTIDEYTQIYGKFYEIEGLETLRIEKKNEYTLGQGISKLTNLKGLMLGSGLKELPKEIGQLSNLEALSIKNCREITDIPDKIALIPALKMIVIKGSGIEKNAFAEKVNDLRRKNDLPDLIIM